MRKFAVVLPAMGLLFLLSGCDDSDGVKPGEQTREPVPEVQRKKDAEGGGASSGLSLGDRLESFDRSADELAKRVDNGANAPELEQKTRRLTDKAVPILDNYAEQNPDCTDYLSRSKAVVGRLGTLTLADLRRDYIQGEALPEAPAKCEQVQQLLIRPAAMVIMVQNQTSREAVATEIRGLLQAVDRVRNSL